MVGLTIGRFRITRKLGAGGMAEVYEAKHELMDRYAAVKLLRPEMSAQSVIVQRFFQEAQAAARIEHPGIVHVYDVGRADDGRAYLVMELLHGETLSERMRRCQRLSVEATVTTVRQLAGVIGAAHQAGIVHRDLKPENVFLVPDPEMPQGERVKVLDFGLAKLLEDVFPTANLTAHGAVFGTPAYMAPEQCRSSGDVDQRADIYAIGCIFYTCLCGRAPFGTGGIEVLLAHMSQAPAPPRHYAPDVPPAVEELILQLLAKDPEQRSPSCEAFIAHLDRVIELLPGGRFLTGRSQTSEAPTMKGDSTLQGALAFAARQVAAIPGGTAGAAGRHGTAVGRDASRVQQPRRGVTATTPMRAPAPAMQLVALPWQPDRPDSGVQLPAGSTGTSETASRASTPTLSNGELERLAPHEPRSTPGRRRVWAIAGLACVGGVVATSLTLGTRNGEPPIAAKVATTEERRDVPAPPPAPPAPPVSSASLYRIDDLLLEAEEAIDAMDWDRAREKLVEANALDGVDAQHLRLEGLARQVFAERQSQDELADLRAAAEKRRIEDVLGALGRIPENSVYRADALADALAAVHARARRLARTAECEQLTDVIAAAAHALPEATDELQVHNERCEEVAARDPREILDEAWAAYKSGDLDTTSKSCRELRKRGHVDEETTTLCGLAACKSRDEAAARRFYERPWRRSRSLIAQTCLKEFDFDVQKKPAPEPAP